MENENVGSKDCNNVREWNSLADEGRITMKTRLIMIFIVTISLWMMDCSRQLFNSISVHTGCANGEVESDVRHSISTLKDFFHQNSINIEYVENDSMCVYELKSKEGTKLLMGTLTDIELKEECIDFFLLK